MQAKHGVWILVLIAIGALAYFLVNPSPNESDPTNDSLLVEGGQEGEDLTGTKEEPLTGLRVTGKARQVEPPSSDFESGASKIKGQVTRLGVGAESTVELRFARGLDASEPGKPKKMGVAAMIDMFFAGGLVPGKALRVTKTKADGRFEFDGLGRGHYEVRAFDEEDRSKHTRVAIPVDGAVVAANVSLPDGDLTFQGKVSMPDGTPFRGWAVIQSGALAQQMNPFMMKDERAMWTDEQGEFSFKGLAPGEVSLTLLIPHKLRVMKSGYSVPQTEPVQVVISEGASKLTGTVVSSVDDAPIGGAMVMGGGGSGQGMSMTSVTSLADGTFAIELPKGANGGIFASAEGFGPAMIEMNTSTPSEDGITITLSPVGTVSGRVLDEGGEGLAGVEVTITSVAKANAPMMSSVSTTSGEGGAYEVGNVVPGQVTGAAKGSGFISPVDPQANPMLMMGRRGGGEGGVALEPGGTATVDVKVLKAGRVVGRVTSSDGASVVGAVVSVSATNPMEMMMKAMGVSSSTDGVVVTDAEGAYVLDPVAPGAIKVSVDAVGFPKATSDSVTPVSGGEVRADIVMKSGRAVVVNVVDADTGKPVAGATVILMAMSDDANRFMMESLDNMGTTGPDGSASFASAPNGKLSVAVTMPDYLNLSERVPLPEGEDTCRVELVRGLTITGTLRIPDGLTSNEIRVLAQSQPGANGGPWVHQRAVLNKDGTYEIKQLPSTTVTIRANAKTDEWNYKGETTASGGDTDVNFTLERTTKRRILTIRLKDPSGDAVLSGTLRLEWNSNGSRSTDYKNLSNGVVHADIGDENSKGALTIHVSNLPDGLANMSSDPYTSIPANNEITLRLEMGLSIKGTVRSETGGVAGVQVAATEVSKVEGQGGMDSSNGALTDAKGQFEIKGLRKGSYELRVKGGINWKEPSSPPQVPAGRTGVTIRVSAFAVVNVTVVDGAGDPVQGARVMPHTTGKQNRRVVRAVTNADGVANVGKLDGQVAYELRVSPPNEQKGEFTSTRIEAWRPADTRVVLPRGYAIKGRAVDQNGKPIVSGRVQASPVGEGVRANTTLDDEGSFELKGLAKGEYKIVVHPTGVSNFERPLPGSGSTQLGETRAEAGKSNVVVQLNVGHVIEVTFDGISKLKMKRNGPQVMFRSSDKRSRTEERLQGDSFVFYGAKEGETYAVGMYQLRNSSYYMRANLKPGDRVTLQPKKGRTLKGKVNLPAGSTLQHATVSVELPGGSISTWIHSGASFQMDGVPPGTWPLKIRATLSDGKYDGNANVTPGTSASVSLTKDK